MSARYFNPNLVRFKLHGQPRFRERMEHFNPNLVRFKRAGPATKSSTYKISILI